MAQGEGQRVICQRTHSERHSSDPTYCSGYRQQGSSMVEGASKGEYSSLYR